MTKDESKKALDLAGNIAAVGALVADMGSTGGAIAGGKLLWETMSAVHGRRRQRQAQAYLDRVAVAMGDEATRITAELLHDELSPVWDTIEEGFRAMMGAIHEDAKQAISALVADYVVRQSQPDREYQLGGGLLAAADGNLLKALFVLTQEFVDACSQELDPPVKDSDILEEKFTVVRGPGATIADEVWVLRIARTSACNYRLHSSGSPPPAEVDIALRLLDRFEFGSLPSLLGYETSSNSDELHHSGGDDQLTVAKSAQVRMCRLHEYLRFAVN